MENNDLVPSKTTTSFFGKIKNVLKSIFSKKYKLTQHAVKDIEQKSNDNTQQNFMESLKEKTDSVCKEETLEYVIDSIEKEPQILDNLTTHQLEEVNDYYDKEIEKVDKKISKIKNDVN